MLHCTKNIDSADRVAYLKVVLRCSNLRDREFNPAPTLWGDAEMATSDQNQKTAGSVPAKAPVRRTRKPAAAIAAPETAQPEITASEIPAPETAAPVPPAPVEPVEVAQAVEMAADDAAAAIPEIPKPVVEAPVLVPPPQPASIIPPLSKTMVPLMSSQTFKGYEDFAAFGKANLDAFVQANSVFAKGVEEISKEVVSLAQSSMESSAAATKAIFAAKTLKDMVELQADFAKSSLERLMSNSTKIGEMTVKLATDSAAPLSARINASAEKALRPGA